MSIIRSTALNNLPQRKVEGKILSLVQGCETCSKKNITRIEQAYDGLCERCSIMLIAMNRYAESNIPIIYWDLNMDNFKGADVFKKCYEQYVKNISNMYNDGISICLCGNHGIGKSMTATNMLKTVLHKNYLALYSTLEDIVNALLNSQEDRFVARKELMIVDFLVIDEFDNRFFNSENSSELFGKTLESIFRTRMQNKLPSIMISNSPNPLEGFTGNFKQSIDSLFSNVKMISSFGSDFRKNAK